MAAVAEAPNPNVATLAGGLADLDSVEAALAAEESTLVQRAQTLERQVKQHKAAKAAAKAAREQEEARRSAEEELLQWQGALRTEVETAVNRINEQRVAQLERCANFEETLQGNIKTLQDTLHQVRHRAAALDTAFDACVQRLSSAYVDAVALRRQQAAEATTAS